MLKGLPLAYQRDLQEDKRPLFDGAAQLDASLAVMAGLRRRARGSTRARMRGRRREGFTTATAVADALVEMGVPFRVAHHVVGEVVRRQESAGATSLEGTPDEVWRTALAAADDPVAVALAADAAVPERLRRRPRSRRRSPVPT